MIPLKDENPTLHPPILTVAFIALNLAVFLWQSSGPPIERHEKLFGFATVPLNVTRSGGEAVMVVDEQKGRIRFGEIEPGTREVVARPGVSILRQKVAPWITLFTAMFMHGGWMHLIGNMFFLWIFGNNIEDALGRVRFVIFYLATGLAAAAAHIAFQPSSPVPCVGASGAISGVLGGYLLLYPRARILTLVPLGFYSQMLHIPALVFLPFWFLQQIFGVLAGSSSGVAWWAHIGGFVLGIGLVKLLESAEHKGRDGGRRGRVEVLTPFDRGFGGRPRGPGW